MNMCLLFVQFTVLTAQGKLLAQTQVTLSGVVAGSSLMLVWCVCIFGLKVNHIRSLSQINLISISPSST